ncbi:MAG: hypothetical protein AAGK32_00810 [Actinomycetota bacterium]
MSTATPRERHLLPSVTRIADFDERSFSDTLEVAPLPRERWATGQYVDVVVGPGPGGPFRLERRDGRLAEILPGDRLIGALGSRAATLQVVGDWQRAPGGPGSPMDLLSMAGVVGVATSVSHFALPIAPLTYEGHVHRRSQPLTMGDFSVTGPPGRLSTPVVLIIGTSMDAGKTIVGTRLVRLLRAQGATVAAAKLTGVGRYRDVQALGDAGADWIVDFVDAGLPSTAVPRESFCAAVAPLLGHMDGLGADVAVVEAGASPLEPYNGRTVIELLGDAVKTAVLCASDPYAAAGVIQAFDTAPSVISGRAASTTAAVELTERLTGHRCIDLLDQRGQRQMTEVLHRELELW